MARVIALVEAVDDQAVVADMFLRKCVLPIACHFEILLLPGVALLSVDDNLEVLEHYMKDKQNQCRPE